jgi:hypothetical protein
MKPPHHKLTATLRIIDLDDPAWDTRYLDELADLEGEELKAHPMMAYRLGVTHFDLDAEGVVSGESAALFEWRRKPRDYLRELPPPRVFECRRLGPSEVATCLDRGEHVGRLWAFQLACKGIEGAEGLTFAVDPKRAASDGQVQAAADAIGVDVLLRIGRCILDASRAPTPSEGKRSGSSPGGKSPPTGVSPAASPPGSASETA